MKVRAKKTKIFKEGDDLASFIRNALPRMSEGSILVVTSKIVALAQGRTGNPNDKEKLIRSESDAAIKTKYVWLTRTGNAIAANAGIDDSNAKDKLILAPKNAMGVAASLHTTLKKLYRVKKLGILITDSIPMPLRAGVIGVTLGYAGFNAVRDYRGKLDLFGRRFRFSQTNVADSLASAATVVMGEGDEQQPLAVITDAPVVFSERVNKKALAVDMRTDMYAPLLKPLLKKRRGR